MKELIDQTKRYLEFQTGLSWGVELKKEGWNWQIKVTQNESNFYYFSPSYDPTWEITPLNNLESLFCLMDSFRLEFQRVRNRGIYPMFVSPVVRGFLIEQFEDYITILDWVELWEIDDYFPFPIYKIISIADLTIEQIHHSWIVLNALQKEFSNISY